MNKYTYKVKVRLECEKDDCDQTFLREDEHYNSYKMNKKDLLGFYDSLYEDCTDDEIPHCPVCNSFLIETKIVDYKEIKEKKRYYDLRVAVDENDTLIVENGMRILGVVIEGTDWNGHREMIDLPLTEENYIKIYNQAKKYWDKGDLSKYVICFMNNDDRCFQYTRPDKNNFEKMVEYNQLISKTELDVCEEYCNKNFTLLETTNGLKRRYEINAVADIILDNYNEVEYKEL